MKEQKLKTIKNHFRNSACGASETEHCQLIQLEKFQSERHVSKTIAHRRTETEIQFHILNKKLFKYSSHKVGYTSEGDISSERIEMHFYGNQFLN